jgi:2-polyprenyl-3-methyl-5-hydroxy-6-metoxy-1,4-benzoquinol methylase
MNNYLDQYIDAYASQSNYSFDNELMMKWYPNRIIALSKGDSLLELGIGHGYSTRIFAENYKKFAVVDGSLEIINKFKDSLGQLNIDIIHSFFEELEPKEKYDNISMGFILEHVDNPGFILSHYSKFLNKNGSIFIAVPNFESLHKRIGFEAGLIEDIQSLSDGDLALGHQRLFSVNSMRYLVESVGYKVMTIEGIMLKPFTTKQILGLNLSPEVHQAMLKVGTSYPELCNAILMEVKPIQ